METGSGAAWRHGGQPPWMEQPPWFDESDAADRADLAAALHAERIAVDLIAERFGPPAGLTAERGRLPRPPALVELAELAVARRSAPAVYARRRAVIERRAVLEAALNPAALIAEQFGPLAGLTAERGRLPQPPELAAARHRTPPDYAHRRAALEAALHPTHQPADDHAHRAA